VCLELAMVMNESLHTATKVDDRTLSTFVTLFERNTVRDVACRVPSSSDQGLYKGGLGRNDWGGERVTKHDREQALSAKQKERGKDNNDGSYPSEGRCCYSSIKSLKE